MRLLKPPSAGGRTTAALPPTPQEARYSGSLPEAATQGTTVEANTNLCHRGWTEKRGLPLAFEVIVCPKLLGDL